MRTRRVFIHISRTSHSIFLTDSYDPEKLHLLSNIDFSKVINIITLLVLAYFQVSLGRVKQISYLFHIDFKDRDLELELYVFWRFFNSLEQVLNLSYEGFTILGMIPRLSFSLRSQPCIVCVFPELVCPYAMMVPLKPSRILLRTGSPTQLKTSYCVLSISKTWSYMNDMLQDFTSFIMSCVFLLMR